MTPKLHAKAVVVSRALTPGTSMSRVNLSPQTLKFRVSGFGFRDAQGALGPGWQRGEGAFWCRGTGPKRVW